MVTFADLTQNPARTSDRHDVGRQIFGNNTSRSHNRIIPDFHAGQNDHACTKSAVLPSGNRQIVLIRPCAQLRQYWMPRCRKGRVRANHCAVADIDVRIVNTGQIKIRIDVFPEMDVCSAKFT